MMKKTDLDKAQFSLFYCDDFFCSASLSMILYPWSVFFKISFSKSLDESHQ